MEESPKGTDDPEGRPSLDQSDEGDLEDDGFEGGVDDQDPDGETIPTDDQVEPDDTEGRDSSTDTVEGLSKAAQSDENGQDDGPADIVAGQDAHAWGDTKEEDGHEGDVIDQDPDGEDADQSDGIDQIGGQEPPDQQDKRDDRDLYENPEAAAHARATELQGMLGEGRRGRVTMGAGVIEDASGTRQMVLGTSERNGYIRPELEDAITDSGQTVVPGNTRHAEQNIVNWAQNNDQRVVAVGAGRPVCDDCVSSIEGAGGTVASPRRHP